MTKSIATVSIDVEIIEAARKAGINISEAAEWGLASRLGVGRKKKPELSFLDDIAPDVLAMAAKAMLAKRRRTTKDEYAPPLYEPPTEEEKQAFARGWLKNNGKRNATNNTVLAVVERLEGLHEI